MSNTIFYEKLTTNKEFRKKLLKAKKIQITIEEIAKKLDILYVLVYEIYFKIKEEKI